MLARHVSDLTGPSSGAFCTSCICRFGTCVSCWTAYILQEGGNVISPTHRPPYPPRIIIPLTVWVAPRTTVRPEVLCQWKIPMTPSGIEPATFRPLPTAPEHVSRKSSAHGLQSKHCVWYNDKAVMKLAALIRLVKNLAHVCMYASIHCDYCSI